MSGPTDSMATASRHTRLLAMRFVVFVGIVSLFADMTYEGARSITGPFLGVLGASGNPTRVGMVDVMLAATGSGFRIRLGDWEDWLDGEWFECCHHEIEREALAAVLPLLRSKLPTAEAVVPAAGMDMHAMSDGPGCTV
jgi:hypothetical protein